MVAGLKRLFRSNGFCHFDLALIVAVRIPPEYGGLKQSKLHIVHIQKWILLFDHLLIALEPVTSFRIVAPIVGSL